MNFNHGKRLEKSDYPNKTKTIKALIIIIKIKISNIYGTVSRAKWPIFSEIFVTLWLISQEFRPVKVKPNTLNKEKIAEIVRDKLAIGWSLT